VKVFSVAVRGILRPIIPVHAGDEIPETLLGSQWLEIVELVVNKSKEILTIEIIEFDQ